MKREHVVNQAQSGGTVQGRASERPASCGRGVHPIAALQHTIGNRAVGRFIQARLEVGQPGDIYEQEADRVAEQVMRMPDSAVTKDAALSDGVANAVVGGTDPVAAQLQCACVGGAPCVECAGGESAQRKPGSNAADIGGSALADGSEALDAGRPLDQRTRAFFEPRLGHNFGHVRVHAGPHAGASARHLNAVAYTMGRDIVFGAGQFAPESAAGRHLLAHELAHVVQQGASRPVSTVQRQLYPPIPIVPLPLSPMPVEVNAVDPRQEPDTEWYKPWRYTGPLASFFRGDVKMTDIASMVDNVITHLGGRVMHRLNIMDHGNENGAEIGDDWLASPADVTRHRATLSRLGSRFASGALVHMQNCLTGQNQGLICALASAFGVPVFAGTGSHNPLLSFNFGSYVSCAPGGAFNPDSGRPQTPTPSAPIEA